MRPKRQFAAIVAFSVMIMLLMCIFSVWEYPLYNQRNVFVVKTSYKSSKCEVIHIGIVATGCKYSLFLHTMLKSLLFYRSNPIHLHIMVDTLSKMILKILFETWALPEVTITFYDTSDFLPYVEWIPKSPHYSGKFGLLKLLFPKAVPLNITKKLIIIDTDLIFTSDVYELWNFFKDFNEEQAIGVVEHQNDYYLGNLYAKYPWPAIGRGFNTGVVLYHLEHLKSIDWDHLWTWITKQTLTLRNIRLPDQDIINAVLKESPSLLYRLPCQWNIQLNDFTDSYKCYANNKAQIVHWNSPRKLKVANKDGDYFRMLHTTFQDYDGNHLRKHLHSCSDIVKPETEEFYESCNTYQQDLKLKRRTLLFIRDFKHNSSTTDVTFITQLSRDKLKLLEELGIRWNGPISLTLYVTDVELHECLDFIENSPVLKRRRNIAYHAVFKEGNYHPINYLRNVALRNAITPYVFLVDLDLIPMKGLYSVLLTSLNTIKNVDKLALVVPAFESEKYMPKNKNELLKLLTSKKVFPFHYDDAPQGHNQTNYEKWKTAKEPYGVQWAPYFEPYIVVNRDVVEYDTSFVGFGWNKVSHIMELEAQKYKFLVLTNGFVVHRNHPDSNDLERFKHSKIFHACITNIMKSFVKRVNKEYGIEFSTNIT